MGYTEINDEALHFNVEDEAGNTIWIVRKTSSGQGQTFLEDSDGNKFVPLGNGLVRAADAEEVEAAEAAAVPNGVPTEQIGGRTDVYAKDADKSPLVTYDPVGTEEMVEPPAASETAKDSDKS